MKPKGSILKILATQLPVHLFLGVILTFCIVGAAQFVKSEPVVWQKAGELIQQGNYDAALVELQVLSEKHPEDALLMRLQGVCLIESGDQDAAVQILRNALSSEPDSISSRYFLAQALAYRGSVVEAIELLQDIIKSTPDSQYAIKAQGVLPELLGLAGSTTAISDEHRWNLYASIGGGYDDNVSARPDDSKETTPADSWRTNYSLYGEIRFPDQKIDSFPFTLGLGASVNGSFYDEPTLNENDLFSNTLSMYLSRYGHWGDTPYDIRAHANYSQTDLDQEEYSNIFSFGLKIQNQWTPRFLTNIFFTSQNKDFVNDSKYNEIYSQSGADHKVGLEGYYYLLNNKLILGLKYAYRWTDPDGTVYEIESHEVTGSMTAYLPWSLKFYSSLNFKQEDYPEYTPDPPGRLDDVWRLYVSLERPIYKDILHVEVSYNYTTSNSELDTADYHQNIIGLSLNCSL